MFKKGDSHGGDGITYIPPSVIFIHGLGDTGQGWGSAFEEIFRMSQTLKSRTKVILPTAPILPVTLNGGFPCPAWFDLAGLTPDSPEDSTGFERSRARIRNLIEQEAGKRIILGGFSQGAAMTYFTGLYNTPLVKGLIVLSGWLPFRDKFDISHVENRDIPIFVGHGNQDLLVVYDYGKSSAERLKKDGLTNLDFRTYPMAHEVCSQELRDIAQFISQLLE